MPADRPRPVRSVGDLPTDTIPHASTNGGPAGAGPVPARVGPYEVARLLGRGGMGAVYECREAALKRAVAVKVMLPDLAGQARHKARFVREAQAQARVEHDHIIPIYRVGEAGGVPFIVMPLLKGGTLADYLKTGVPPLAEAVRIGREMAEGLAAAHAAGLVHRDVKPGNVGLDGGRRRVKLLDFGLARPVVPEGGDEPMTHSGAVVGTPAYMSPEQARGKPVDHRTDLFALGVVLYELLVGRRPFLGADVMSLLSALALDQPDDPAAVNPAVPPALSGLVMRLLSKNPGDRPADATAVADELRAIEGRLSAVQVVEVPPADPFAGLGSGEVPTVAAVPVRRRPWGWVAAGFAALVAAAVLAGVVVRVGTQKGTLVVESDDPAVEVVVKKDGAVLVDRTARREIELAVGDYGIELAEKKDGLRLTTERFEIVRGGKATVRVRVEKAKAEGPAVTASPSAPITPSERRSAELLGPDWRLTLRLLPSGNTVSVQRAGRLPAGDFEVVELHDDLPAGERLPADYTDDVFLPAVKACKSVEVISCASLHVNLSPDQFRRFAAAPPRPSLRNLGGFTIPLTPATVDLLLKFPQLGWANLSADDADDALLARLSRCRSLDNLGLYNLGHRQTVTARGWAAVAAMPLRTLRLIGVKGLRGADLELVAKMPALDGLLLSSADVDETLLPAVTAAPRLRFLSIDHSRTTDAAVPTLLEMRGLRTLHLTDTRMTRAGAQRVADGLPGCAVTFAGTVLPPTPAPTPPEPKPADPPAIPPPPVKPANTRDDRPAIEALRGVWDVTVRTAAGNTVVVKRGDPLPAGKLALLALYDSNPNGFEVPDGYVADVLAANTRKCPELTAVGALNVLYTPTLADMQYLLAAPGQTLADVSGLCPPLTAELVETFRKARGLRQVCVAAGLANDTLLGRFADLKGLDCAWVLYVGSELRPAGPGLAALGRMATKRLYLNSSRGLSAADLKKLAGNPHLSELGLNWSDTGDAEVAGLAGLVAPTLYLAHTNLSDAGVPHLLKLTNLTWLDVSHTKLTAAGAKRLADGLPRCEVHWGGGRVKPGG